MKILAIRTSNLASLEGENEIDFTTEPLQLAGIFAITGPTGAGKSTILDALCLALYARTPRYDKSADPNQVIQDVSGNTITQSDPRGILRDGAGEGWAEVDFIGIDGYRYRSRWNVRRARSKVDGALQAYQLLFKNLDTNADEQGNKSEILSAISQKVGLTFEQFTRAVLLAQGDFTAFLKASNSEKSDLLEKLTGTHIFSEISKRIFEHHRHEKERLDILNLQMQGINILKQDDLETLNNRRADLANVLKERKGEEEALSKELNWHRQLSSLQEKVAQSEKSHQIAIETKEQTKSDEEKLRQTEQVQPARQWMHELKSNERHLAEKFLLEKDLEKQLLALQENKQKQDESLKAAQQKNEEANKRRIEAQPFLDKAKELDVKLDERLAQLTAAEKETTEINEKLEQATKQVNDEAEKKANLEREITQLEEFIEKHKNKKLLAENHKLVVTKLNEAGKLLYEEKQVQGQILQTENALKTKGEEAQKLKKVLDTAKKTAEHLATSEQELQKLLTDTDATSLEKERNKAEKQTLKITQAVSNWKTLLDATQAFIKTKVKISDTQKEFKANQKLLQSTTKELDKTQTQKEAAEEALNHARLASAGDVIELREQLIDGKECPVCGSKEHPYGEHDPRLDRVLTKLQADYRLKEKNYNETQRAHTKLTEKINQAEELINSLSVEQTIKEREIKDYRQNWERFSDYKEAEEHNEDEISGWLKLQVKKQQAKQEKLRQQAETFQQQQKELGTVRTKLGASNKQWQQLENQMKDNEREQKSLHDQLERFKGEVEKVAASLSEIETKLSPYFTNEKWFELWKKDSAKFVDGINEFARNWTNSIEKHSKAIKDLEVLKATILGLEQKQQLLKTDFDRKTGVSTKLHKEYQSLKLERAVLFEGKPVNEVETEFKTSVEKAQKEFEECKSLLEEIDKLMARAMTQREELKKEQTRLQAEMEQLNTTIENWLNNYNNQQNAVLSLQYLTELLALPPDWIENERKKMQDLNNALLQSKTLFDEHKSSFEKHQQLQLSKMSMEEVDEKLNLIKQVLSELTREDAAAEQQIKQDTESRTKAGAMLKQIETQGIVVDNWARLNHVIGSADGKKFRHKAQEYTLDVLLGYANVHLDMLSKRYLLQRISNGLGLQVVDQDMGNEVRTVNSLSGGESFLVSLALALGLASLSSSRMKVESLFIDEGFGALDPDTLNVAMDALERLHNQGRKVGVISHVQEMMERIPVQIKVRKLNGGKSMVEVIA
jgi:exonuclease SbcC